MNTNLLAGGQTDTYSGAISNPLLKGSFLETLQTTGFLGSNAKFIEVFVPKFIGLLFVVGGASFFFMFVWGAISWILSGGDKAHLESAKGRITSAIVGLILLISTFAIVKLIERFFGIDILSIDIGPLVIQ